MFMVLASRSLRGIVRTGPARGHSSRIEAAWEVEGGEEIGVEEGVDPRNGAVRHLDHLECPREMATAGLAERFGSAVLPEGGAAVGRGGKQARALALEAGAEHPAGDLIGPLQ